MPRFILRLLAAATIAVHATVYAQAGYSTEILEMLEKAKAGDSLAQFRVAAAFDYGRGAPRDGQEAMRWYKAAAEQGMAEAQNSVGSGLQAEKKYSDALPWFEKASAQDHALATNNLAYLYDLGLGIKQDRQKAFELYTKAADLGWAEAMWNLTNMIGAGQVGKPDLAAACVWAVRAQRFAKPGERQLINYVSRAMPEFEKRLSAEQMASCKEQAASWSPRSASPTQYNPAR